MGKRLLVVFLAAVLAVGLTACGGSSGSSEGGKELIDDIRVGHIGCEYGEYTN